MLLLYSRLIARLVTGAVNKIIYSNVTGFIVDSSRVTGKSISGPAEKRIKRIDKFVIRAYDSGSHVEQGNV